MRYLIPILILLTTPAIAADYDGSWRYSLSTASSVPSCNGFANGKINVADGAFRGHIGHAQDSFRFKGEVADDGASTFKAVGNYDTAEFVVSFKEGTGTWQAKNLGCNGTIELRR